MKYSGDYAFPQQHIMFGYEVECMILGKVFNKH